MVAEEAVAEFAKGAINLKTYTDYNLYYYVECGMFVISVLIGVLIGCFFWKIVFERLG